MGRKLIVSLFVVFVFSFPSLVLAEENRYIIDDISIDFSRNKDVESEKLQQEIVAAFEQSKERIYFGATAEEFTQYRAGKADVQKINKGQFVGDGVTYTVIDTKQGDGGIRLVSQSDNACGFFDCIITLHLRLVDDSSPELQKIKASFAAEENAWQERLARERAQLAGIPLHDFPGVVLTFADNLAIKVPLSLYKTFAVQDYGVYWRRMGDNGLYINIEDPDTRVYSFRESMAEPVESPSGGFIQNAIIGELFVVKAEKNDAYLDRWLASQNGVLSRTGNGAIYYNEAYHPEAVYFQYDDATGRYLVARASAEDGRLATVARAFAILRTMEPSYRGNDEMSLADLALSQSELENRYQEKVTDLFKIAETQKALERALRPLLEKPERFVKPLPPRILVESTGPVGIYGVYVDVKIHHASLEDIMADNQKKYPDGKRHDAFFISAIKGGDASYAWYYRLTDDITLEFPAWFADSLDTQLFLAQVFKQLDFGQLPQIPANERKNLFKYHGFIEPVADIGFAVDEGLIDNDGNMLITMPKNGKYSFEWRSPHIIATLWKSEGEGVYRNTGRTFAFDRHGKAVKKP